MRSATSACTMHAIHRNLKHARRGRAQQANAAATSAGQRSTDAPPAGFPCARRPPMHACQLAHRSLRLRG